MAHLFRAESGIRLTISAPGYLTPSWRLDPVTHAGTVNIDTTETDLDATAASTAGLSFATASPTDGDTGTYTSGGSTYPQTSLLAEQWTSTISAVSDFDAEQTGSDQVTVTWQAPSSAPDEIDHYLVTEVVSGGTRTVDADDDTAGVYTSVWNDLTAAPFFVVRAESASRHGEPLLSGVLYDAPTLDSVTGIDTEPTPALSVSWTAPSSPSLAIPLKDYRVEVFDHATSDAVFDQNTSSTSIVVPGLSADHSYDVRVTTNTFFLPVPGRATSMTVTGGTCPSGGCP
jgi:hypothetical protein